MYIPLSLLLCSVVCVKPLNFHLYIYVVAFEDKSSKVQRSPLYYSCI